MLNVKKAVITAHNKISQHLSPTPLFHAKQLSLLFNANIYLKLENLQPTNSFKVRGAFNKLLSLTSSQKQKGIVAASTGNHGAAVAYGCKQLNVPGIIYVPNNAAPNKVKAIKSHGAEVRFWGEECGEAEQEARKFSEQNGLVYISPYNDVEVIGGQGTIGYEILQQLKDVDVILTSIGGGGLIAGIAGYVKSVNTKVKVIGCLPSNSPVMSECIKAGKIITMDTLPTLSDATAGNMDLDSITFPLCQTYVDDYILVSEDEIKSALRMLIETEHLLAEGSVGVTIAALNKMDVKNKNIVAIVSGANISMDNLKKVID